MTITTKLLDASILGLALLITGYSIEVAAGERCFMPAVAGGSSRGSDERVRVIVRSKEQVSISSELNARITQLPQREGDRFEQGALLVTFDCSRLAAEREASIAAFNAARAAHNTQVALGRYKAAGSLTIEQSKYEMEKADAEVRVMDARLSTCSIRAPFAGRVVEKSAQVNEIAQPNQPLIKLINEDRLDLVLMVPSAAVDRVRAGTRFQLCVDETREAYPAEVVQSTGLIDPVSQSVRMIAEFIGKPVRVLPGMSGTAYLTLQELN